MSTSCSLVRPRCPSDATLAKSVKRIGTKAPVALRLSAELIDRAAEVPIEEGLALELSHLREIFATKDAHEGLSSLGRKTPVFVGTVGFRRASGFRKSFKKVQGCGEDQ